MAVLKPCRKMKLSLPLLLLLLASMTHVSNGGHFLGIPVPFRSHALTIIKVTKELNKYHGHTATLILPEYFINESIVKDNNVSYVICKKFNKVNIKDVEGNLTMKGFTGDDTWLSIIFEVVPQFCDLLLTDTDLLDQLRKQKFDMAIIDNIPNCPCVSVLAYKLSIPYVHIGSTIDHKALNLPLSLSSMPINVNVHYSNPPTLMERIINVVTHHVFDIIPNLVSVTNAAAVYAHEKPFISDSELKSRSSLELLEYDILVDMPITSLPNIVHIGGITIKPAKTLTGPLGDFMEKAKRGAVLVSFGSLQTTLPESIITKLTAIFRSLSHLSFIVKVTNYTFKGDNVFSSSWVPQNDILGHRNLKVFVTHCGHRGQFEAVYHGVPMVGLPLHSDQPFRARTMVSKGYGIALNVFQMNNVDLEDAILEMMENTIYMNNVKLASQIYKSRIQTPGQKAAFWIDHVFKYGGDYLRPYPPEMSAIKFRLIDVYTVIIMCLLTFTLTAYYLFKKMFSCCCGKQAQQKKWKKD